LKNYNHSLIRPLHKKRIEPKLFNNYYEFGWIGLDYLDLKQFHMSFTQGNQIYSTITVTLVGFLEIATLHIPEKEFDIIFLF
jgi:hypothetical protein